MQSYARTNYRVHQPTTRVIQSELSSASLNHGKDAARTKTMSHDDVQFQRRLSLPETTNQQVRLMSPKVFYNSWIQEHQDTRTRTPTTNKKPLLGTSDDVEIVDADFRNANQTSTPQRSRHELSEIEQSPSMVTSKLTAASSVEKSNPSTNDENPAVSIIVHNQPVAHNATISEFAQHELDNLTPIAHNAITTEFAQHELNKPTSTPNPATLHNHKNSLRNSDTMSAEQQEESEIHNASSSQFALSIANFTMKHVRRSSNETSSRSTMPTITSESYGGVNEEITSIDTEWARIANLEDIQRRVSSNSSTETQLSNLTKPALAQELVESLSSTDTCSDQVSSEPKPKKRHHKGKGLLLRKAKRKMESCDMGKEPQHMEINKVSEPRKLSPKSNSTITHQLNESRT